MGSEQQGQGAPEAVLGWERQPRADSLKVVSFNTLADAFVSEFSFGYCPKQFKKFEYRHPQLIKIIKELNPDLLCLQEVDQASESKLNITDSLALLGLRSEHLLKTTTPQGIVLAWNEKKVHCLKVRPLHYDDHMQGERKSCRQSNVALLGLFEHVQSGRQFAVATTHLHWNPKEEHIKYLQLQILLHQLEKAFPECEEKIICGDLNSLPGSNTIEQLRGNTAPTLDRVETSFRKGVKLHLMLKFWEATDYRATWRDVYEGVTDSSNITVKFEGRIDHLWLRGRLQAVNKIVWDRQSFGLALPSKGFPSDHLPIGAELVFE